MNRGLEFEGKNVKLAIEKACSKLNLTPDEIKYDVISNGSSGIFGLVGVKKARIRVSIPASEGINFHAENTDLNNQFINDSSFDDGVKNLVDEAFNGNGNRKSQQHVPKAHPKRQGDISRQENSNNKRAETKFSTTSYKNINKETSDKSNKKESVTIDEQALSLGTQTLQKIIDLITTGATISSHQDADKVIFNISGGNSGVLIGKRGQTLEAIQYIIDKIINKHNEKRIRVRVDVEGYLENRKVNLIKLAEKLAEKTKKTGKPSTIGQMNAQDRRTVHIALKSHKAVRTQSIGNGYYRKLVIFPKRNSTKKKKYTESATAE